LDEAILLVSENNVKLSKTQGKAHGTMKNRSRKSCKKYEKFVKEYKGNQLEFIEKIKDEVENIKK